MLDKMETGQGHLGGPVEHSEGKGGESAVAILRFLCSSPRLCRLRTEGLVPMRKYWTYRSHAGVYGPSKPSSLSLTEVWLKSIASLVGLGEKLDTDPRIDQPACCGLCREPFFSGAVGSVQICRRLVKGCHVRGLPARSIFRSYRDWHGKHTCHVDQISLCRVYIDSNRRDSRIWVTTCSWLPSNSNLLD
jgi:hypothetical protein